MCGWTRMVGVSLFAGGLAAAATLATAVPAAQEGSSQVVVRAVTGDGQPVLDLKPGDVTIRVDGREREVTSLDLVKPDAAAAPAGAASAPAASSLPAPYATNEAPDAGATGGREFLIVIDDEGIGIGRESAVRDAVTSLVQDLTPADRVGIMAMKQGGMNVAPSTQHAAVTAALPKIITTGSSSESVMDLSCRTKVMLGTLGGLLQNAPANRTIVFFSAGMASTTGDQMRTMQSDSGVCQIRTNDLDELGKIAMASPAQLYVVYHVEGLANPANVSNAQGGLENVAGTTAGEMVRMSGNSEPIGSRIAETAGTYYIASLAGGGGPVRRVDARVNRDGVRVTARPVASAAGAANAKAGSPRDMIRTATVFSDVTIRAAGFASRQPNAKELMVVALFEPEDPSVKLTAAIVGLFDEKGTLRAQWTAKPDELQGAPVAAALTVVPGKYRMRVAATDSTGKGGTTDYDLLVNLPEAPPLQTSHMLLGVGQGGFAPKLAFTAADAAAIGFIELYGVSKDAKVDASFEIVKADGEVLGTGQGTVGAGKGEDARIAYGGFGIATLEPGDYTMRATITVDGKQAGVASRTLRKLK
jgi:hypothetical protein